MIGFKTIALASGLSTAALAGAASAATVSVGGLIDSANNTATVDVSYQADLGTLTFGVENTGDSIITGFAFNTPTTVTGISALSVSGLSATANARYDRLFSTDGVETPQSAGRFDAGTVSSSKTGVYVTSNAKINGGFTGNGVDVGKSATFVFTLMGTDLNLLTVDSFLNLLSAPEKSGKGGDFALALRFQRAPDEGSDVGVPVNEVPLPAAGLLMLAGLGGLIGLRRRAA